jgi:hypothetical protein
MSESGMPAPVAPNDNDITVFLGALTRLIGSDDLDDLADALDPVVSDFCDQEALVEFSPTDSEQRKAEYHTTYDDKSEQISNAGAESQAEYLIESLFQQEKLALPLTEEAAIKALQETGWFGDALELAN